MNQSSTMLNEQAAATGAESERTLRDELDLLSLIYDTAPVGLAFVGADLRFQRANERFAAIHGLEPGQIIGRTLTEVLPGELALTAEGAHRQLLAAGAPIASHTCRAVSAESGEREWMVSYHPVRNGSGDLVGVTMVMQDITDRKHAEDALGLSEARYRDIVETQTDLVSRYLPDMTLTFVNEAYCRFFNRTRGELIGSSLLELIPEPSRAVATDFVASLVANPRTEVIEHEVLLPDGTTGWQHWVDHVILGPDGRVTELQGIGRDITDRKRAEEELERRARELQALFDVAPVGIAIGHDRAGSRVTANAAFQRMVGNPAASAQTGELSPSRPVTFLRGGREISATELPMARAVAEGIVVRGEEIEVRRADGSVGVLYGYASPVLDSEQAVVGCIGAFVDMTDRLHVEVEADEQRRELARLARVATLGELSGSLAHELTQPLTAILANAYAAIQYLDSGQPNLGEVREILADIAQADLRAVEVIRHARALMKKERIQSEPLDLNDVVDQVLALMRAELMTRKVTVTTALSATLPPARGDSVQLQQVVLNLVLNACDAMASVPIPYRRLVITTAPAEDGAALLSVSDRGEGIHDAGNSLFQPFYTTKESGLGLGLSICRSIVHSHGGQIWAVGNPDGGATFHVRIPGVNADAPEPAHGGEWAYAPTNPGTARVGADQRGS